MPQILGKLAICFWCDEVHYLKNWDPDWDEFGCPVCIEDTR